MNIISAIGPFAVLAIIGLLYAGAVVAWHRHRKNHPVTDENFPSIGGFGG